MAEKELASLEKIEELKKEILYLTPICGPSPHQIDYSKDQLIFRLQDEIKELKICKAIDNNIIMELRKQLRDK